MRQAPTSQCRSTLIEEGNPKFEVSVIDVATKKTLYRLLRAASTSIRFTPDGNRLVCLRPLGGDYNRAGDSPMRTQVDVHEATTGKRLQTIILPPGRPGTQWGGNLFAPYAVADEVVVIPWTIGGATVYDLKTGKSRGDLAAGRRLEYISISRDGRWLLALEGKRHLSLWDVKGRKHERELHKHDINISAISISADGKWCASVASGARCSLFNRKTGRLEAETHTWGFPHDSDVGGALTADGSRLMIRMESPKQPPLEPRPAWAEELDRNPNLTRSFLWIWDCRSGKPPRPLALVGDAETKESWKDMGQFEPGVMTADGNRFASYPRYGKGGGVLVLELKDRKRPPVEKPEEPNAEK